MRRFLRLLGEAGRSLWGQRTYALLMMIGLVIGISSVTVIYEMGEGVRHRVVGMMSNMGFGADAFFIAAGGGRLGFRRRSAASAPNLTAEDVAAIARLDNTAYVVPQVNLRGERISHQDRHTMSRVWGVPPEYAPSRRWDMHAGRFLIPRDEQLKRRVAVLGFTTAQELFGEQSALGRQIRLGSVPLTVVGVLAPKGGVGGSGRHRDDRVLVPMSTAQRRLSKQDKINAVRVNLHDPERRPETVAEVAELLRQRHRLAPGVPDDFTIITPEALVTLITRQSRSMVVMLTFISAVSLFVSGIVIMNIMLVAVSERAHEIGVRRAVGARRADIMGQVLCESVLVALAGGVCGLGLGLLLSRALSAALDVPTAFSAPGFALSFLFSAGVGLVFGVFPARKAANLAPVEALR